MKPAVTDLRIEVIDYYADGQDCRGSNLMYKVDGKPASSRVPWVATIAIIETVRLEKLLGM